MSRSKLHQLHPWDTLTCFYITSLGGTMLYPNQTVLDPELTLNTLLPIAQTSIKCGGGFSTYSARPAYKTTAVLQYFPTADPRYPSYYDTT